MATSNGVERNSTKTAMYGYMTCEFMADLYRDTIDRG
jgi:hypothetical protein